MRKIILALILGILLVGLISFSVIADNNNSGNQNQECKEINGACCLGDVCDGIIIDCIEGYVAEFEGCDENCSSVWECEEIDEDDDGTIVNKIKTEGNKTTFIPWQKRNESECPEGCTCHGAVVSCKTETGKIMTIEAGRSGNIITITIERDKEEAEECETECEEECEIEDGVEECKMECEEECEEIEVDTELELEQEETDNNKTKLKAKLSNGKKSEIKIMPDVASETALEKLRLKVCSEENNCVIELKEVGKGNETQLAYELQAERHVKLLGLFRIKMLKKVQVNAENGELIRVKKPWWAFLAVESEEETSEEEAE